LAYADDDLPSRRSQREQRQPGDNRRQAGNPADLASTLRQLEPPKPQNIERSQPAPDLADTTMPGTPTAEEQRQEQRAREQQAREQQAHEQQAREQQRQEQLYRGQQEQQQYRAPEPEADPFAEFLNEPTTSFSEPTFDQPRYGERSASTAAGARFGQQQQQAQLGQQSAPFEPGHDGSGQFGYAAQQTRIGTHTPLAYTPFVWIIAMIPLIQLVGILLVVSAVDVAMAMPFLAAIAVGPYIAGIPLAIADH